MGLGRRPSGVGRARPLRPGVCAPPALGVAGARPVRPKVCAPGVCRARPSRPGVCAPPALGVAGARPVRPGGGRCAPQGWVGCAPYTMKHIYYSGTSPKVSHFQAFQCPLLVEPKNHINSLGGSDPWPPTPPPPQGRAGRTPGSWHGARPGHPAHPWGGVGRAPCPWHGVCPGHCCLDRMLGHACLPVVCIR